MAYLGLTSTPIHRFGADNNTVQKARYIRKRMTQAEKILWSCIRKNQIQGYRFRRQHPLGHYIADFYCVELKLVIEVDGESHIGKEEYDATRLQAIKEYGLIVLIFSNEEVFNELHNVLEKILSAANKIHYSIQK